MPTNYQVTRVQPHQPAKKKQPIATTDYSADLGPKPPQWRWYQALYLRSMKINRLGMNDNRGDAWIRKCMSFLYQTNTMGAAPCDVRKIHPEIFAAKHINEDEATCTRWFLEAFLLSPVSIKEIADAFCLSETVVTTYEKIFFDLREYRHKPYYVYSAYFQPLLVGGIDPNDLSTVLAYGAWKGGPDVLKFFMEDPMLDPTLSPAAWIAGNHRHRREIKNWMAVQMIDMQRDTQFMLLSTQAEYSRDVPDTNHSEGQVQKLLDSVKIAEETASDFGRAGSDVVDVITPDDESQVAARMARSPGSMPRRSETDDG